MSFVMLANLFNLNKEDQYSYITLNQATRAFKIINSKENIMLYCNCCDVEEKIVMKEFKLEIVSANYKDFYQLKISTKEQTKYIDLAYSWVLINNNYQSVAGLMNLEIVHCEN